MVRRAVPFADGKRMLDRAGHVPFRPFHGLDQRVPLRQIRGDGRCIRAPGSVRILRVDPRHRKGVHRIPVVQKVDRLLFSLQVSPFYEHGVGSQIVNAARCVSRRDGIPNLHICESRCLVRVGRKHGGDRYDPVLQGIDGFVLQQRKAAL